jgi:hypothetical protein
MNDYTGPSAALLAGAGIGDLPPGVQPELMRDRRLVEVMPEWRFRTFDLSVVHFEQPAYTVSGAIVQGIRSGNVAKAFSGSPHLTCRSIGIAPQLLIRFRRGSGNFVRQVCSSARPLGSAVGETGARATRRSTDGPAKDVESANAPANQLRFLLKYS